MADVTLDILAAECQTHAVSFELSHIHKPTPRRVHRPNVWYPPEPLALGHIDPLNLLREKIVHLYLLRLIHVDTGAFSHGGVTHRAPVAHVPGLGKMYIVRGNSRFLIGVNHA